MNLFLAMTPAQLLNCIVLQSTLFKNTESDLYYTGNIKQYAERLSRYNLFSQEYEYKLADDITDRSNAIKRGIVRIKNALDIKIIEKTAPSDLTKYEKVFASGISLRNYELYYAIKMRNKATEIAIYEEGICEYYHYMEKSILKELFSRLFFHSFYPRDCKEMYVYEPSIVRTRWKNISVKMIPKFSENKQLLQLLNEVFGYEKEKHTIFENKVVFLESSFYDQYFEDKQREYLDLIVNYFGKERVIVKMHPRSSGQKYDEKINIIYSQIPFEIIAANIEIEGCVFFSMTTSIIINFKLMLGKEPVVICLNRMNKKVPKSESEKVFDRVKALYTTDRFFIPGNDNELRECINSD